MWRGRRFDGQIPDVADRDERDRGVARRRNAARFLLYDSADYKAALARIAASLRRIREARHLTQEAAAEACGISVRTLQDVEGCRSNVTLLTLVRLASGLGVDIVDLLRPTGRGTDGSDTP